MTEGFNNPTPFFVKGKWVSRRVLHLSLPFLAQLETEVNLVSFLFIPAIQVALSSLSPTPSKYSIVLLISPKLFLDFKLMIQMEIPLFNNYRITDMKSWDTDFA